LKGELAMCLPRRFTDTVCSPTSRGVKDIPAKGRQMFERSRCAHTFSVFGAVCHLSVFFT
jgi:hypothetical protein